MSNVIFAPFAQLKLLQYAVHTNQWLLYESKIKSSPASKWKKTLHFKDFYNETFAGSCCGNFSDLQASTAIFSQVSGLSIILFIILMLARRI